MRYAAIETAYRLRHRNQGALFERAVRRCAGDEQAWVRGIVADCLAEWILREAEPRSLERLRRLKQEIIALLHDTDLWPLEAMQSVVRGLRDHGMDVLSLLGTRVSGLLGRVPQWDTLGRPELEPALDALVRPRRETVGV